MTFRRAERDRHAGIEITKNIQDYSRQKGRTERKKSKYMCPNVRGKIQHYSK